MVAEAIVRDARALYCNCRLVFRGVEREVVVKARSWDCPSCGRDKRQTLQQMVAAEGCLNLLTLTFRQPHAYDSLGQPATPLEHRDCDRYSHVYLYTDRDGQTSWRWRAMSTCKRCCKRRYGMLKKLDKRMRRMWGNQYRRLMVMEDQKNGSMHMHLAMAGCPDQISDDDIAKIKSAWLSLGGGWADVQGSPPGGSPAALGWYLGKYLAKQHEQRMARGYRRWARSRAFACDIKMRWVDPALELAAKKWSWTECEVAPRRVAQVLKPVGWRHPFAALTIGRRFWLSGLEPAS